MSGVSGSLDAVGHDLDDEAESVTRPSRDQRAEELQVFWSFIVNMLINLESLPLDRIFTMLKMYMQARGTCLAYMSGSKL